MKRSLWLILWSFMLLACMPPSSQDLTIELLPGVDTVEVGATFEDAGAQAFLGETPQDVTIVSNTVDITAIGRYQIVYQAQVGSQIARIMRYVDVIDTTAPEVTLQAGVDTILIGGSWSDAGVAAVDNSGLTCTVVIEGAVANDIAGEYQIVYVVTDPSGNTTRIVRYVNVVF